MYLSHLGKFNVPANDPDWVPKITYTPEPPIVVRGAMNPWQEERQRVLFMAEEAAWKTIQRLQGDYRGLMAKIDAGMREFNAKIAEVEAITGKKSGINELTTYASLVYSLSGGPYAWAVSLGKLILELGLGFLKARKKKKKLEKIKQQMDVIRARLAALSQQVETLQKEIGRLIRSGDAVRSAQAVQMTTDMAQSESAYRERRALDRQRADVLRERNRQVAQMSRTPGGSDVI